jgi:thiamine-phosphate pyrophosphorylase
MSAAPRLQRGLYAITGAGGDLATLLHRARAALDGGAVVLQYRRKGGLVQDWGDAGRSNAGRADMGRAGVDGALAGRDGAARQEEAAALAALCRRYGVPLIVNDDVELAAACGAAGVHLGRADLAIGAARARLGPGAIIGCSCYDSLARAAAAVAAGADYLAFGAFHPSPTKPDAVRAYPALLRAARARYALPLVAIGGILPGNAAPLVAAGADLLAAISGWFDAADPEAAARAYGACFIPDPTV